MFPFPNGQLGSYHLIRRIGGGGMGEVYLAEDRRMGLARQVAIKTIRAEVDPYPDHAAVQDAERLFRREMQAISTLDHPFILPLYDFGEEQIDNTILTYMVMPFRPEGSLANWLQKRDATKLLSPAETAHFVEQAAQALQHAHSRNLIHQDVKPANFLIRERSDQTLPDILLSDFGIVKIASATATASQSIRGTPAFMAPEQWNGQPVAATDQYALAIMAYLLLTRQFPFKGRMEQVMRQHLDQQPQAPGTFNPAIPPDLDRVILHALQKSPKNRFSSISAFANAFQQAIQSRESAFPAKTSGITPLSGLAPTIYAAPATPTPIPPTIERSFTPPPIRAVPSPSSPIPEAPLKKAADASGVLKPPVPFKTEKKKESHLRARAFLALVLTIVLIIAGIGGSNIYQNQINIRNANIQATANTQAADAQASVDAQASATAQIIAQNPCPSYIHECGSFSLALLDSLQGPDNWSESSYNGVNCNFNNNAFSVQETQKVVIGYCTAANEFENFVFEVKMISLTGICGGIIFEYDSNADHEYLFEVCPSTTVNVENYYLIKYEKSAATPYAILMSGKTSYVGSENILAVAINHGLITLYVNQLKINSTNDSSFAQGQIGLLAESSSKETTATYTNARVWA